MGNKEWSNFRRKHTQDPSTNDGPLATGGIPIMMSARQISVIGSIDAIARGLKRWVAPPFPLYVEGESTLLKPCGFRRILMEDFQVGIGPGPGGGGQRLDILHTVATTIAGCSAAMRR